MLGLKYLVKKLGGKNLTGGGTGTTTTRSYTEISIFGGKPASRVLQTMRARGARILRPSLRYHSRTNKPQPTKNGCGYIRIAVLRSH